MKSKDAAAIFDDELSDLLECSARGDKTRPCGLWHAGFKNEDKQWTERQVTRDACSVLNLSENIDSQYLLNTIVSAADDPPDCEVRTVAGSSVGVEVTELFNYRGCYFDNSVQSADGELKLQHGRIVGDKLAELFGGDSVYSKYGVPVYWDWEFEEFKSSIVSRVCKKDRKLLGKGTYYDKRLLVINTDEFTLTYERVASWVREMEPIEVLHIDEGYILTTYEPPAGYHLVKIPLLKKSKS